MTQNSVPHIPVLGSSHWYITGPADVGDLAYGNNHEIVDHAIWQSADGQWHCWACVRGTKVGRVFFGWEGNSIEQTNWKSKGITMRVDRAYGESINDWQGEEWIQAPHVIQENGLYYMFYGGHNSELGECQICVATSKDGRTFERYKNPQGFSRVFTGPGEARDPMVLKVGDEWVCYYSGFDTGLRKPNKVYSRTSSDLYHWSDFKDVSWGGFTSGTDFWSTECPFVVFKEGYYYMFRTSEYRSPARTHVYRSQDPFDFGLGTDEKYVATLRVAAPEVVQVGNDYYISSNEDLKGGIQLFKLNWM